MAAVAQAGVPASLRPGGRAQAGAPALAISGASLRFAGGISSLEALHAAMRDGRKLHTTPPFARWAALPPLASTSAARPASLHLCQPPGSSLPPRGSHLSPQSPPAPAPAPLADRWDVERVFSPSPEGGGRVATRFGTYVGDVHAFDSDLFGLAPAEAALMDPQQRLLLEEMAAALGASGRVPRDVAGSSAGVFVGCIWLEYAELLEHFKAPHSAHIVTGNGLAFMAGRLSYTFGLAGPCVPTSPAPACPPTPPAAAALWRTTLRRAAWRRASRRWRRRRAPTRCCCRAARRRR